MEENNNLVAKIESLLFIYGEPLSYKKIAGILKSNEEEIKNAIQLLEEEFKKENRGLFIIHNQDEIQLSTKPEFGEILENIIKEEFKESLSPASLETLSIILYANLVSRNEIDFIRGVNSTFILRSLLIRGLIDRLPDPKRSNAYLYQPSFELLKYIGISKTKDLPEYQKFSDLINKLKSPLKEEQAAENIISINPVAEKNNNQTPETNQLNEQI